VELVHVAGAQPVDAQAHRLRVEQLGADHDVRLRVHLGAAVLGMVLVGEAREPVGGGIGGGRGVDARA
jgi:hypothetical protein